MKNTATLASLVTALGIALLSGCAGGSSGGVVTAQATAPAILISAFPPGASTPATPLPGIAGANALTWLHGATPGPGGPPYLIHEAGYSLNFNVAGSPACPSSGANFTKIIAGPNGGATYINLGASTLGPDAALDVNGNFGSSAASYPTLTCTYTIADLLGHSASITMIETQLLAYVLPSGASAPADGSFGSTTIFSEHFFGLSLFIAESGYAGAFTLSGGQGCPITTASFRAGTASSPTPIVDFPYQSYSQFGGCRFLVSDAIGHTITVDTGSP